MTQGHLRFGEGGHLLRTASGHLARTCDDPPTCCTCGNCCFSEDSVAQIVWTVTNPAGNCLCTHASGNATLPFERCDFGLARWARGMADCNFIHTWTCAGVTFGLGARAARQCSTGRWSLDLAVQRVTATEPCTFALEHNMAVSGSVAGGDCCGITVDAFSLATTMASPPCGLASTYAFTIAVADNRCCDDAQAGCVAGEADCDGGCPDAEEEGI